MQAAPTDHLFQSYRDAIEMRDRFEQQAADLRAKADDLRIAGMTKQADLTGRLASCLRGEALLSQAIADSAAQGFVKVLTAPGKDTILGATIVGEHAGDLLAEFVLAMRWGLGLNKILSTIHTYPTLAESNKYVAGEWKRSHAPQGVLRWLARFHAWRRGAAA